MPKNLNTLIFLGTFMLISQISSVSYGEFRRQVIPGGGRRHHQKCNWIYFKRGGDNICHLGDSCGRYYGKTDYWRCGSNAAMEFSSLDEALEQDENRYCGFCRTVGPHGMAPCGRVKFSFYLPQSEHFEVSPGENINLHLKLENTGQRPVSGGQIVAKKILGPGELLLSSVNLPTNCPKRYEMSGVTFKVNETAGSGDKITLLLQTRFFNSYGKEFGGYHEVTFTVR